MKLHCDLIGFSSTGDRELVEPYWQLYLEHDGKGFSMKYADEPSLKAVVEFVNEFGKRLEAETCVKAF